MSNTFKDIPAFGRERRVKDHRPEGKGGHTNLLRWATEQREEEEAREEANEGAEGDSPGGDH